MRLANAWASVDERLNGGLEDVARSWQRSRLVET